MNKYTEVPEAKSLRWLAFVFPKIENPADDCDRMRIASIAKAAEEIFEEIERNIYVIETPYQKIPCLPYGYIAELKKKYQ